MRSRASGGTCGDSVAAASAATMSSLRRRAIWVQRAMSTERSSIGARASARTTAAASPGSASSRSHASRSRTSAAGRRRRRRPRGGARRAPRVRPRPPALATDLRDDHSDPSRLDLFAARPAARSRRRPPAPARARSRNARRRAVLPGRARRCFGGLPSPLLRRHPAQRHPLRARPPTRPRRPRRAAVRRQQPHYRVPRVSNASSRAAPAPRKRHSAASGSPATVNAPPATARASVAGPRSSSCASSIRTCWNG